MDEKLIILVDGSEPIWKAWLRNIGYFSGFAGISYFVNVLIEPSGWLNFAVALGWLIWIFGIANKHKFTMSPDQARAWIDEKYPKGQPHD
jgi:hypothetical protein